MAAAYQRNDYDFVVKRERGVLEREAFISPALYRPERLLRETMLTPPGCSFINVDYERHAHATVARGFLVAPALTGKFRGFRISFMLM